MMALHERTGEYRHFTAIHAILVVSIKNKKVNLPEELKGKSEDQQSH